MMVVKYIGVESKKTVTVLNIIHHILKTIRW